MIPVVSGPHQIFCGRLERPWQVTLRTASEVRRQNFYDEGEAARVADALRQRITREA